MATHALWNLLQQLKSDYEWVELSHRLNNDSPYWSGMPEGSVEIGKTVFDWGNPMLECSIQTFKFPANSARILISQAILPKGQHCQMASASSTWPIP